PGRVRGARPALHARGALGRGRRHARRGGAGAGEPAPAGVSAPRLEAPRREGSSLAVAPGLEAVRALAGRHRQVPLVHTWIADCETPVSAFLKLRGDGPCFLLESAEEGQRLGRYSMLGIRPQAVLEARGDELAIRHDDGTVRMLDPADPLRALEEAGAPVRLAPAPRDL